MKRKALFILVFIFSLFILGGCGDVVEGPQGPQGEQGIQGEPGKDGHTPVITIGDNGNWFIDGIDTGVKAEGLKGDPGAEGVPGKDGRSIVSISLTSSTDNVDTYTILYSDNTTFTFEVTNGINGVEGIQGEPGKDGHTPVITIENGYWYIDGVNTNVLAIGLKGEVGNGISSVEKTSTEGLVDTYTITFSDGKTTTYKVTNGENGASISKIEVDENGYMVITLSNGITLEPIKLPVEEKCVHNFCDWIEIKQTTKGKKLELRYCITCNYSESREVTDFSQLTFVAFGDSITYGADLIIGGRIPTPYPTEVNNRLGFKSYSNLGVSGATYTANNSGRTCMTDIITSYTSHADIIGVLAGVNDYYAKAKLGTINDNDTSTIYGALHVSMSYLKENYSDSFIFYMTPYKCYFNGILWSEQNSLGYTLEDVSNAIKEVAEIYEISVLDLFTYGGFENVMYDKDCDGVHPNQKFVLDVMSPQIADFIKEKYN